jgi:putative addiction module component (TIGR02574 family)
MASTIDTEQLLKLSAEQKLRLISLLWDSLREQEAEIPVDDAILDEAEGRIAELIADPSKGIPLEEFRRRRGWIK